MDLGVLRAAAEKARRFTHELEGRTFELVLPTQFAIDCLGAEHKPFPRFQRRLVLEALRGWSGLRTTDLGAPELPDEPLPFSAETAELLLDERGDWEEKLCDAIAARSKARRETIEAARGN